MTFRVKPAGRKSSRPSWEQQSRRTLYMNIGFGLVVVAAIAILALGAFASWYADHAGQVGSVNGVSISRDDYRARYRIEDWRLTTAEGRLRDAFSAGHITAAQRDAGINALEQQRSSMSTTVLERLVDAELQRQLAPPLNVAVTSADVDQRLVDEATTPEERHAWVIEVAPVISDGATEPTADQKAAAKAKADAALADLTAGKAWEDVAKATSTAASAAQAGDLGWLTKDSTSIDPAFLTALFAAQVNTPTAVVEGADGTYRIGRVTELAPQSVDQAYQQKIADAGIAMSDYRRVVESDIRRQKLTDAITASVTDVATDQRRVAEIYLALPQGQGDEVQVRHILFAPNDITDQTQLDQLPDDDPAWDTAKADAQAAYDKLKAYVGTSDLETQFQALAKTDSDDTQTASAGGELPYFTRDQLDQSFGDAIFADGLKKGDLIGPVRSQYGWHVILFEDRRPDPLSRITDAKLQAEQGKDFGTLAKAISAGPEASLGGELGWVAKYQLSQQLEDAIFATPVGKTSDIITVDGDGFYLFKVEEAANRKPEGDQLATLKSNAFDNWYTTQKGKATITRETDLPTVQP